MPLSLHDINSALLRVKVSGRSIDELQGLLMHPDDVKELLKLAPETQGGMEFNISSMFGVKIIESEYAQKGTIFNVFKDKIYLPESFLDAPIEKGFKSSLPCSGMINLGTFPPYPPEYLKQVKWTYEEMNSPLIEGVQKTVKEPESEPETEKPKRNHSTTRKIELD